MTTEYAIALEESRKAAKAYAAAQADYMALKINDAEFLAARAAFVESDKAFDEAYAKEEAYDA